MTEHNIYMIKLIDKSKEIYFELKNAGFLPLDIQTIAMFVGDCSKASHTVELTKKSLELDKCRTIKNSL